jgi:proton glutamate symport protein
MKRISFTSWILVSLFAGAALGAGFPGAAVQLAPVSNIFIILVKSIIAPLLFGILVTGVAGAGLKAMGRIGWKSIVYFEVVTGLALLVGLAMANTVRPGEGVGLSASFAEAPAARSAPGIAFILENAVPTSIFDSMARGDVLQVVVFCLLFGAACASIGERAAPVLRFAAAVAEIMFRFTAYVMYLAPAGVFAATAVAVGSRQQAVFAAFGKLVVTLYAAEIVFVAVVYGGVALLARVPLRKFVRAVKEPVLLAFSTCSSAAALPLALENLERYGVPKHVLGFVMPIGFSFNLAGTTLYLPLAVLFFAQVSGIEMPLSEQLLLLLALKLSTKGVAVVPRSSLVILAAALAMFHIPMEGLALILGVDAVMDMVRTSVNLLGNCLAGVVVAKWDREVL